jgi:hypothetical protein
MVTVTVMATVMGMGTVMGMATDTDMDMVTTATDMRTGMVTDIGTAMAVVRGAAPVGYAPLLVGSGSATNRE